MEWSGFALLLLVGVGIISTGLPAAFVLIAVACLGAALGLVDRHDSIFAVVGAARPADQSVRQ